MVTGGSDGIGLELCDQLASQGFNICMIARNLAKMNDKITTLRAKHPSVDFKAVVADFSELTTMQEYHELIKASKLHEIDIGLVFLNAGCVAIGPFDLLSDEQVESSVRVNALHPVYLAKAFLPLLTQRARPTRSAMVVTSSGLAGMPMPSVQMYSSTKACVSNFFQGLAYEVEAMGVDVMAWEAGSTDTAFVADAPKSKFQVSTQVTVAGCLKDLGREKLTSGTFMHDFQSIGVPFFPLGLLGGKIADQQRQEFIKKSNEFRKVK